MNEWIEPTEAAFTGEDWEYEDMELICPHCHQKDDRNATTELGWHGPECFECGQVYHLWVEGDGYLRTKRWELDA